MQGRHVEKRKQKHNPLYLIFIGLCAAVLVLLAMVILLSARLRTVNKDLASAKSRLEQYETGEVLPDAQQGEQNDDGRIPGDDIEATEPDGSGTIAVPDSEGEPEKEPERKEEETKAESKIGWLDLTGHTEVKVAPKSVFDKYYTYYATNGVNLRAGPGTDYDRVTTVSAGTEVEGAAKDGGWTFVKAGSQFGWISADYLSTTKPETAPEAPAVEQPEETETNDQAPADTGTPEGEAAPPEQPAEGGETADPS